MTSSEFNGYHGIDIGGTKIELVSWIDVDGQLEEVHRERIATPKTDFEEFVASITGLLARSPQNLTAAIGIGLPGVVDSATGRQLSCNVPALNGRRVTIALQEVLACPVFIGNDCQCFALSEAQGGAAANLPSMFGAVIGTGAGGGYCIEGRLQWGFNALAGEWGHWTIPATLLTQYQLPILDCSCGKTGCFERYVSGPGLSNLYAILANPTSNNMIEPPIIVAKAKEGDLVARKALAIHLDLLSHAFAQLVLSYDPHAIVLGGGLSKLSHLYEQLPAAMSHHLFRGVQTPSILPPRFGDAGGARGAALLARQRTR